MTDKSPDNFWRRWELPNRERGMFLYYRGGRARRTLPVPRKAVPVLVVAVELILVIVCG
jgi:hypothetical protein